MVLDPASARVKVGNRPEPRSGVLGFVTASLTRDYTAQHLRLVTLRRDVRPIHTHAYCLNSASKEGRGVLSSTQATAGYYPVLGRCFDL